MTHSKVLNSMIEICEANIHALKADGRDDLFDEAPVVPMEPVDPTAGKTKSELKEMLDEYGLDYDENAKKSELVDLVKLID